jgi:hypothetical protein
MKRPLRLALAGLLILVLLVAALLVSAAIALKPAQGEWSTTVRIAGRDVAVGVPSVIRLATAPWFAPVLEGRSLDSLHGPLTFAWTSSTETLSVRCAPCTAVVPGTERTRITTPVVNLTVHRDFHQLTGVIETGSVKGQWQGVLTQQGLNVSAQMGQAPIAAWYTVLVADLPELSRARIEGTLAMNLRLSLPDERLRAEPRITGFRVSGLGTQEWATLRSCGRNSRLANDSWLAKAVIAAEDQRFMEHAGWDIAELATAFDANQQAGRASRGASTLTQQLAKLLVTGDERTLQRKLRELLYAVEMEEALGKARILRLYLDNAPWGPGACGAEQAARNYFGRPAHQLTAPQAVWLAAMLHNPGQELERWKAEGTINQARAEWVAGNLRGISRGQRAALRQELADARWPAPGSQARE